MFPFFLLVFDNWEWRGNRLISVDDTRSQSSSQTPPQSPSPHSSPLTSPTARSPAISTPALPKTATTQSHLSKSTSMSLSKLQNSAIQKDYTRRRELERSQISLGFRRHMRLLRSQKFIWGLTDSRLRSWLLWLWSTWRSKTSFRLLRRNRTNREYVK